MVQLSDVYRQLLKPLERTLAQWEKGAGFKAKLGRWFRIGPTPPGQIESGAKLANYIIMAYWPLFQRAWGPLYKRAFEMDMSPGKGFQIFARHRWFLWFWFGSTLVYDFNSDLVTSRDPDYLNYYIQKYKAWNPPHNALQYRTSAHYLEISKIYTTEMFKKIVKLEAQLESELKAKE